MKEAMKDICAFANTDLGIVYFGVKDNGAAIGQEISDRTIQKVTTDILSQIEPRLYPNIYPKIIKGKSVLIVEVKNAPERPYFLKGKAYKRVGTSNVYLSKTEIERFFYERENPETHYDRTITDINSSLINQERIEWFFKKATEERNLPVVESNDYLINLEKLNALTDNRFTIAGLLAFGFDHTRLLPTTFIKCGVFEGTDKTGRILDHLDIKDDVFRQINLAENFVLRNIRKSAEVNPQSGRRESRYEVPYRAIREAIANAVAHRDYRISSTIDVAIFDDRIEIWSPGTLPVNMTMTLLHQNHPSVLRNSTLAELLYLTGYIERWGTGIQNMKDWMKEENLPEPEYTEIGSHFLTVLKQPNYKHRTTLGRTWDKTSQNTSQIVLEFIKDHADVTIKELAEIMGISDRAVKYHLKNLTESGKLKRIGSRKTGFWKIRSKNE